MKLNQLIAILNGNTGRKKVCDRAITDVYQVLEQSTKSLAQFAGLAKTYQPLNEDGERFPPETVLVATTADKQLAKLREPWVVLMDTVATQDKANTQARADIVVDEVQLVRDVPVTHLLFLEKQFTDIHTALMKIPVLPPGETWTFSDAHGCYVTAPVETSKIKKVEKWVHAEDATDKHPAQGKWTTDDILTGYWKTIKMHGAMPATQKEMLLARILKLLDATRKAREQANEMQVQDVQYGDTFFDYILNGKMVSAK